MVTWGFFTILMSHFSKTFSLVWEQQIVFDLHFELFDTVLY